MRGQPSWRDTLTYILTHEVSHHVLRSDSQAGQEYRVAADSAYRQLLERVGFYDARQIEHTRQILQDASRRAGWLEELAADMLAYQICSSVLDRGSRGALGGLTTICILGAAYEHFAETSGIVITPTHPYAIARPIAFEKHLHTRLGITLEEFRRRPEWLFPIAFMNAACRLLRSVGESYYPDDMEWDRSFESGE